MREIVLDTETTGMDPEQGHRIIEIGCVEQENHLPSGKTLQLYINPERDIPAEATAVHGITDDFIKDKPVFSEVFDQFLEFVDGAKLVIHNAEFDMKFINWELKQVGHQPIPWTHVIDTLTMARQKFPGSPANLDALCRRFGIDNTERSYHGALLDSELLSEVYLELLGGRQHGLILAEEKSESEKADAQKAQRKFREPREHKASADELVTHKDMVEKLDDALWKKVKKTGTH
ncbi:MAG: DNA polymerase III subunit epsilon [Micavibrio sp.]|nr:MAG: DNA polymerase III subunit epsilon [Micavibrio sp.]